METVLRLCAPLKGTKSQKVGGFCAHLLKMLTQNQTQNIQNQLLLENPNTSEPYYSLCNFKERQEALAVEKLRGFDEIAKSKALYQRFFGFSSWAKQKNKLESQSEDIQGGDDGITLMYKMLSLEDDSFRRQKRANESLSGWEVCDVQLHDKTEYLKGKLMWKDSPSTTRKSESKSDSFGHSAAVNQNKKEVLQCKPRKWEFVEPKIAKQDMNVQPKDESSRQNTCNRSDSPNKSIKFHQFSNTNDYMKYYRENVTHTGIKQHFFNRLEGKTDKVRPRTFPLVKRVKSQAKTESPAKVYRFHITDNASFGILKVGPCPSLKMKKSPRKRDENEAGKIAEKFIIDIDYKKNFTRDGDSLKANASRLLSDRSSYSLSPKKSTKSRKSYPIPTANTTDFDEVTEVKSDEEVNGNDDGVKVKKVGLKINKAIAPRLRAKRKAPRLNKPKQNQTAVANRTKQGKSCQRVCSFSTPSTNTLGDKEFLRITKPKVIGINPANQKGSSKFDSSLSNDQLQASVALYPWVDEEGGIPRGRLIETNHIINHQLLKSRLPEKGFQVCITPSSYPKSTIGIKMQIKTEDTIDDEAIQL